MVLTAGALAMKMPHGMPSSNWATNITEMVSVCRSPLCYHVMGQRLQNRDADRREPWEGNFQGRLDFEVG
jgi:hypothetical protein